MDIRKTDVVIVGSGLAALMTADYLCDYKNVMLITKSELRSSNSWLAQGGIAAAVAKDDHWQDHYNDTVAAGAFHNCKEATSLLVKQGTKLIKRLIQLGVNFDKDKNGEFSLGMEGAHGKRRILHAGGDATGKVLIQSLLVRVVPNIEIFENKMAYDLHVENGVCRGVYTKDKAGLLTFIEAEHVIIATGGVGQLYSSTSNCNEATGDGIAMAYRAGAAISDMEFLQFHPTLLKVGNGSSGLISEAVRGEGARLVTEEGTLLMKGKHPMEDLAPRDVVAREIYKSYINGKKVFLDISNINNFQERFPSIYLMCQSSSEMYERGLLLVEPGAHFMMGGIKVNKDGQSSIKKLYAVGECANTGVHGANRLASNSLLEAVVFAERLAMYILKSKSKIYKPIALKKRNSRKANINLPTRPEINKVMDQFVGIVRTKEGLKQAVQWFDHYQSIIHRENDLLLSNEQEEIINLLTVGLLISNCALIREESRGGHYRSDFPSQDAGSWYGYQIISYKGTFIKQNFQSYNRAHHGLLPHIIKELSIS